jgi:hypothetical protein
VNVALLANGVKGVGGTGIIIDVGADDAYAFANVVRKSGADGFSVNGDDCVLVQNSATGSGNLDLTGIGTNTALIDNDFPNVLWQAALALVPNRVRGSTRPAP